MEDLRAAVLACALLGIPACSRSLPPPPALDAAPEDTEIGFDQRGCYGPCAVYSVTFRGDGTLEYEGKAYVAAKGHRSANVSPGAVADLVRHFDDVHFESLTWRKNCPREVHDGPRNGEADLPSRGALAFARARPGRWVRARRSAPPRGAPRHRDRARHPRPGQLRGGDLPALSDRDDRRTEKEEYRGVAAGQFADAQSGSLSNR
jgi:hypothetical protein